MCGIIGKIGTDNVVPQLIKGLKQLEYRGYDSAGIGVISGNKILRLRCAGKVHRLEREVGNSFLSSGVGIGHTRWATHGSPTIENTHPHVSPKGRFALVHNGIIENSEEIKKHILPENTRFYSETDTEAAVHLLEQNYTGDVIQAISLTCQKLKGSYAFGILCTDFPDSIFAVAKNSPLVVARCNEGCYIASDILAVNDIPTKVYRLKDGEICSVQKERLTFFDECGQEITKVVEEVSAESNEITMGGYDHFMLKEIMEQPEAVSKTLGAFIDGKEIKFNDIHIADEFFASRLKKVCMVACGSAYHAGLSVKHFFEELLGIPCEVSLASEFRYSKPFADENTLSIFISQSGETADTLEALRLAKKCGAKCISIVNVKGSTIAEESGSVIYTRAGREIAVATTKAYSAQLAALYALAVFAGKRRGTVTMAQAGFYVEEMQKLPQKITETLEGVNECVKGIAKEIYTAENLFFIGRLTDYAAAAEGALKLKEISYINAQSLPAGELKHGTISLINQGTPVISILGQPEIFDKTLSNMAEVRARGARVIALSDEDAKKRITDWADIIAVGDTVKSFKNSLLVLPLQLLSYYVARLRGCDIDKPRNLAKSVTVE